MFIIFEINRWIKKALIIKLVQFDIRIINLNKIKYTW